MCTFWSAPGDWLLNDFDLLYEKFLPSVGMIEAGFSGMMLAV